MRHRRATKLFDRTANQRKALFRSLIVSLIEHERIETTVAKAKEIRKMAERMVTLGKRGDLHARRIAFSTVPNKHVVTKLFDEVAPRFSDRNGGYLRIIKTRSRIKDNAPLAVLEFVDYEEKKMIPAKPAEKKEEAAEAKAEAPRKKAAPKKAEKKPKAEKKAAPAKHKEEKPAKKKAATKKKSAKKSEK